MLLKPVLRYIIDDSCNKVSKIFPYWLLLECSFYIKKYTNQIKYNKLSTIFYMHFMWNNLKGLFRIFQFLWQSCIVIRIRVLLWEEGGEGYTETKPIFFLKLYWRNLNWNKLTVNARFNALIHILMLSINKM